MTTANPNDPNRKNIGNNVGNNIDPKNVDANNVANDNVRVERTTTCLLYTSDAADE